MKRLFHALFGVVFLILVAFLIQKGLPKASKGPGNGNGRGRQRPRIAVEVSPIGLRTMIETGVFSGSIIPQVQYTVAPKVAGRLRKLFVDAGDTISSGQAIAELDDEEFVQTLAQAQAELSIARANVKESKALLEIADREHQRVKAMRAQKVSSEADVEAALAQLESRRARHLVNQSQVTLKEASVEAARIRLSYTKLNVTWTNGGTVRHVGERFQDEGALLSPNTPIVSIYDLGTVVAVVDVVERDYYKLRVGQTATIKTAALPERIFEGKVARIAPMLDAATRQARIEIDVPNADFALKPGMFVSVHIVFETREQALAVPSAALVRRDGRAGVFHVDEAAMAAAFYPVETGIVTRDYVEIASPTLSGQVVTLGHHLLEDGSPIRLPDSAPKADRQASSAGDAPKGKNRGAPARKAE